MHVDAFGYIKVATKVFSNLSAFSEVQVFVDVCSRSVGMKHLDVLKHPSLVPKTDKHTKQIEISRIEEESKVECKWT